ncbi:Uncharacterized protein APZ42_000693 [Daphnia magna]|uniref:Uncharacterized protein n=1 Tax=Daphnia magna TaxID=35525 RepID=A0A164JG81_9CRUS|nr:Uncharacterized protein APZ42_000693 [Daphnia magna]
METEKQNESKIYTPKTSLQHDVSTLHFTSISAFCNPVVWDSETCKTFGENREQKV